MNHTEELCHCFSSYSTDLSNVTPKNLSVFVLFPQIPQKVIALSPSGCEGGNHEEERAGTQGADMR